MTCSMGNHGREISNEDMERVTLLHIVTQQGLKTLNLEQLKRLEKLVQKKDYDHNPKAARSKSKLLAKINTRIYELEEGSIYGS